MNRTINSEQIFAAAEKAGFKRIEACCDGVPFKACSNDVWKGEIVAFVAALENIGGIGWQQAVTWLCQHCHEFADIGSLVSAMREAAPAAHAAIPQPSQPAASETARNVPARRFRHVKTGGIYTLLSGALNEATKEPLIVYRSEETGVIWVRPAKEFDDGRFAEIERLDRAEGE